MPTELMIAFVVLFFFFFCPWAFTVKATNHFFAVDVRSFNSTMVVSDCGIQNGRFLINVQGKLTE